MAKEGKKSDALTDKQKRFCEEYLIDSNAKQSAIRAGYSPDSAEVEGSRLLRNAKVSAYLSELRGNLSKQLNIDAQWVLKRFLDISNRCMQAEPVMIFDGEQWVESGEYKFDSSGANKATENIGKHMGFFETDNKQKNPEGSVDYTKLSRAALAEILNATNPK